MKRNSGYSIVMYYYGAYDLEKNAIGLYSYTHRRKKIPFWMHGAWDLLKYTPKNKIVYGYTNTMKYV